MDLILGAGNNPIKGLSDGKDKEYRDPVRLDIDPRCNPDVEWDLNHRPLPFEDGQFDEIHAYEVLEHIGAQGDWRGWFDEWNEYYRILKPGGKFCASVPSLDSRWLWGDPGHTRAISLETLVFLSRKEYDKQVGVNGMTDYRFVYNGDFKLLYEKDDGDKFWFVLQKR